MARRVRDSNLETRNARRVLKVRGKPYWRALDKGSHIGYRKRSSGGTWIVRRFMEVGHYEESRVGLADDFQDADGINTLDYGQALEAARAWLTKSQRIEDGVEEKHKGAYTVSNAMDDYIARFKAEGRNCEETQTRINAHILPSLGTFDVAKLSTKRLTEWHLGLASAPARLRTGRKAKKQNTRKASKDSDAVRRRRASANRVLSILKAALNFAWREGRVSSDAAWRKVSPFKNVDAPVIRYLTLDESVRLVNACPTDLRKIVKGALFTGCRYGELANLIVSDFDPDAGTVAVRYTKGGKARHVTLNEDGKRFFENEVIGKDSESLIFVQESGERWGKSHQSRPLSDACKHAEIKPLISFHVLRHTHASFLAMQGVPMAVIARQLGHADTRMTEKHYAHLSPSYVADTIRQKMPRLKFADDKNNVVSIRGA